MATKPLKSASYRWGISTFLTNDSLGPPESSFQTASRSVQRFLPSSQ